MFNRMRKANNDEELNTEGTDLNCQMMLLLLKAMKLLFQRVTRQCPGLWREQGRQSAK